MENRKLILWAIALGFLGVVLGAFGAHGLKPYMDDTGLANFQTANRYHFYHVLFALTLLLYPSKNLTSGGLIQKSVIFTFTGILLFSGSLYVMALNNSFAYPSWLPILTPLGGFCFIISWSLAFYYFFRSSKKN